MDLAQVAALAASQAIDRGIAVQDVDPHRINYSFRTDPLLDGSAVEILVDNNDRDHVTAVGCWQICPDAKRAYGPDYSMADPAGGDEFSMTFRPEDLSESDYNIYMYMPRLVSGQATVMSVEVCDGVSTTAVTVHPASEPVLGQTYGEWLSLGQFHCRPGTSVTVSQRGANGIVVADAVLFVPVR